MTIAVRSEEGTWRNENAETLKVRSTRWPMDAGAPPSAPGRMRTASRKRKVFTAATRHEVADEMTKALRDQQRGINISAGQADGRAVPQGWLKTIKSDVAPSTYVSYEGTVRLHLIPAIGDLRLCQARSPACAAPQRGNDPGIVKVGPRVKKPVEGQPAPAPRHLSSATVKYCLVVLRMALDHACKLDLVPRNVALLVDFPKVEQAEIEPFTARTSR